MIRMKDCPLMQNQSQTSEHRSSWTTSLAKPSTWELPRVSTSYKRLFQAPVEPPPPQVQVPWCVTSKPSTIITDMARSSPVDRRRTWLWLSPSRTLMAELEASTRAKWSTNTSVRMESSLATAWRRLRRETSIMVRGSKRAQRWLPTKDRLLILHSIIWTLAMVAQSKTCQTDQIGHLPTMCSRQPASKYLKIASDFQTNQLIWRIERCPSSVQRLLRKTSNWPTMK